MPRTSYDKPTATAEGVEDYRRRRDARIARNPDRSRRGRRRPGGAHREGDYRSPEETARQDDYQFEEGSKMERDYELNRRAAGPVTSGEVDYSDLVMSTEDAASALAERERKRRRK